MKTLRLVTAAGLLGCAPAVMADRVEIPGSSPSPSPALSPSPSSAQPSGLGSAQPSGLESAQPSGSAQPMGDLWGSPDHVIANARGRFRACYNQSLAADPTVTGSVLIELTIVADGKVGTVQAQRVSLPSELVGCLLDVARKLRFDPPDSAPSHVAIPLKFATPP